MRSLVLILAILLLPAAVSAQEAGSVPAPQVTRGKGTQCVADTGYMRRFHMKELLHQRDETMHDGIRTRRFSLKECIACHATTDANGQPVPINAPGEFCASCHDFAAVRIDCFQCHATKPEPDREAVLRRPFPTETAARQEAGQ